MSYIWWIIGTFGVGGAAFGLLVLILGWPVVWGFLTGNRIGRIILAVATAGLGALIIYGRGRSAGRADELARMKDQSEKEIDRAEKDRDRIDHLPDGAVDDELSKWDRPNK